MLNQSEPNPGVDSPISDKPAAGSTLYYSLLYNDTAAQHRALNTLRLIHTISTTLYDVSEPQVAEKKIHWWHEELSRMAAQSARHPACVAVQEHQHGAAPIDACLTILSAAASERYNPLDTELDLRDHILSDYLARIILFENALKAGATLSGQSTALQQTAQQAQTIQFQPNPGAAKNNTVKKKDDSDSLSERESMALGLGYYHRLNSLANRVHNGYPVFSDEQYKRFDITPEKLGAEAEARPLLNHAIEQARNALAASIALSKEPIKETTPTLALVIMCQLRHAQMQLWQKKQPSLLSESMTLTPVRKFFIAYRAKRRNQARV